MSNVVVKSSKLWFLVFLSQKWLCSRVWPCCWCSQILAQLALFTIRPSFLVFHSEFLILTECSESTNKHFDWVLFAFYSQFNHLPMPLSMAKSLLTACLTASTLSTSPVVVAALVEAVEACKGVPKLVSMLVSLLRKVVAAKANVPSSVNIFS